MCYKTRLPLSELNVFAEKRWLFIDLFNCIIIIICKDSDNTSYNKTSSW